ncbi:MAG: MFS transporter [Chloroflexi bacterium]|nr:MFS transporter [Chloroflexota bacterium]
MAPRARIGFVVGILYGIVYFGNTIGPLLGGYFVDWTSLRAAFFVSAGLIIIAGLVFFFGTRESQADTSTTRHDIRSLWAEIRVLSKTPGVRQVLVLLFLIQFANNLTPQNIPLLLDSLEPGTKATVVGIFFAVWGVALTVSTYGTGVLSGRLQPQWLFLSGAALATTGSVLMATAGSVELAIGYGAILGLGTGTLLTSTSATVGEVTPANRQGFAFGMVQSASAMGFAIGPIVGGVIANLSGLHSPFYAQAGVFLVLVFFTLAVVRKQQRPIRRLTGSARQPTRPKRAGQHHLLLPGTAEP